jgi:hypothetical protein
MSKKILGGVAAAAATAAIGLAVAAPAHATTDGDIAAINAAAQFSADVTAAGFYNDYGPQAQLLNGITVCNNLEDGYTPGQNVVMIYQTGGPTLTYDGAGQFVWFATKDLCPWHFGQPVDASWPNAASGGSPSNRGSQVA